MDELCKRLLDDRKQERAIGPVMPPDSSDQEYTYDFSEEPYMACFQEPPANWRIDPEEVQKMSDQELKDLLINTNERMERVYRALLYLAESGKHARSSTIQDILNPPRPRTWVDDGAAGG